jgi:hypothetical protein
MSCQSCCNGTDGFGLNAIEYDPQELRIELERAAGVIDDEIKILEDTMTVTREVLSLEFTV